MHPKLSLSLTGWGTRVNLPIATITYPMSKVKVCDYPDVAHIMGEVGESPTLTRNGNTLGEARMPARTERNRPSWSKAMRVISLLTPPVCGFFFYTPWLDGPARHLSIPHSQPILGQVFGRVSGLSGRPASACHRRVVLSNHYFFAGRGEA